MAPKLPVHWTRAALSDMQSIISHVAIDKPEAARKLAQTIRAKAESLRDAPYLGKKIAPDILQLVVHRHYLISYRIKHHQIEILRVRHTARQRTP